MSETLPTLGANASSEYLQKKKHYSNKKRRHQKVKQPVVFQVVGSLPRHMIYPLQPDYVGDFLAVLPMLKHIHIDNS